MSGLLGGPEPGTLRGMNKELFDSLADRAKEFGERAEIGEDVRVEVALVTGRTVVLERVVECGDGFVQFDAWDPAAEDQKVSLITPYHQISNVLLMRSKKPRGAGFTMRLD